MFHFTSVQILVCCFAFLLFIGIAVTMSHIGRNTKKVVFYDFFHLNHDREIIQSSNSDETSV